MAKIYLSSTYSDLIECRKAVYDALRSLRHDVVTMEHYVADNRPPLNKCLADVAGCDIYVGIFAWRYGYVPPEDNPAQKSITELEFRHAAANGIPCLIFLLDENAEWKYSQVQRGAGADKLEHLRAELRANYAANFFGSCDELATKVLAAVTTLRPPPPPPPPPGDHSQSASLASDKISIGHLPVIVGGLFGREEELQRLDEAWANPSTHILSLVAWGGVGKSKLVNHWLASMAAESFRGATRVYGWSFFSQGTTDHAVSADEFIEAALTFFVDAPPHKGSPWSKGERLAHLVGAERTLLVLDGLEPLQYPPGEEEGKLKDQALQALLRQLAASNKGLCIITSRVAVADISSFEGSTAPRLDLNHLSPEAGAQTLRALGVNGTQAELEQAAREFEGHSLALTLLGSYLSDVYGGDVNRRGEISDLEGDVRYGAHARKVMASYEKWFGEGPERCVLRILGLFNRPAEEGSVAALRAAPAIPELTDALQGLSEQQWQQTLSKLRRAKLLAPAHPGQPDTLDTHPLVREHFGQQLQRNHPAAWRAGNDRLYRHLTATAEKFPGTMEEMAPLYTAIWHGCQAGHYMDALLFVYHKRIQRKGELYSLKQLGSVNADLAALSCFFESKWEKPVAALTPDWSTFVLGQTGFRLRALGRFQEAVAPMQAALKTDVKRENWKEASIDAATLGTLLLTIGKLDEALERSRDSVTLADRSGNDKQRVSTRKTLGDLLHDAGRLSEAEEVFQLAEEIRNTAEHPRSSHSLGYRYRNLLLSQGRYREVQTMVERILNSPESANLGKSDLALNHLSLGRAHLFQAHEGATEHLAPAEAHLEDALTRQRSAGRRDHFPRALLALAEYHLIAGEPHPMEIRLAEAIYIATSGNMGLHLVDCHLLYARLHLMRGQEDKARLNWMTAKEKIEKTGYRLREADAHLLSARISIARNETDKARADWREAKRIIERIGYYCRNKDVQEIGKLLGEAAGD